ncbi:MAG: VCBS repeat-containing protein [Planctomycetes bacterium]|nr:VCBS repeat-containing protein [Planctomycetota bacterium]
MRHTTILFAAALAGPAAAQSPPALPELAPAFRVEAGGVPIETATGHAAPTVVDFDGDGLWDLAVGQFGGGTCRLYVNTGTAAKPAFGAFTLLQSDGKPASMESS